MFSQESCSEAESDNGKFKIKNICKRLLAFCGKKPSEDDLWSTESSSSNEDDIFSKMTYEEIAIYVDTKARLRFNF